MRQKKISSYVGKPAQAKPNVFPLSLWKMSLQLLFQLKLQGPVIFSSYEILFSVMVCITFSFLQVPIGACMNEIKTDGSKQEGT